MPKTRAHCYELRAWLEYDRLRWPILLLAYCYLIVNYL